MRFALATALAGCLGVMCGGASASRHALTEPHACANASGFTCSTLTVPLDHSGRRAGTLALAVATADNATAPRGVLLLLTGGPGQPGVPALSRVPEILGAEQNAYRIVMLDQRGTGAGALDCPGLQAAMGSSDLAPPPAAAVRACAAQLGDRRQFFGTDDVVADLESLRQALGVDTWVVDGISYGTYVGERYALAHPAHVSKLVLDSVVPHEGETDLGLDEFRAARRVLHDVCGSDVCTSDLAAAVRRTGKGPAIFDALTFESIVDPTFRSAFDLPRAAPRRGPRCAVRPPAVPRGREGLGADSGAGARSGPPRQRAMRRLALSLGRLVGAARRTRGEAARRGRPSPRRAPSSRSTAQPHSATASSGSACPGRRRRRPRCRAAGRSSRCRRSSSTATTTSRPRSSGRARSWPSRRKGTLVVVHGAGHSVQSRAVSAEGRQAVARFLLR